MNWWTTGIKIIGEAVKIKGQYDLEKQYQMIIDKYELTYCDTEEEFLRNFNELKEEEKTIFLKCFPDIYEYLKHARDNPGITYYRKK
jgi:hypothetical protein